MSSICDEFMSDLIKRVVIFIIYGDVWCGVGFERFFVFFWGKEVFDLE